MEPAASATTIPKRAKRRMPISFITRCQPQTVIVLGLNACGRNFNCICLRPPTANLRREAGFARQNCATNRFKARASQPFEREF
jgi:hypothetical protein